MNCSISDIESSANCSISDCNPDLSEDSIVSDGISHS